MKRNIVKACWALALAAAVGAGLWHGTQPLPAPASDTMRFALTPPGVLASFRPEDPDTTCLYARRDTAALYLDIYRARCNALTYGGISSDTSWSVPAGDVRPVILFVFGGGFKSGSRDHAAYLPWFHQMQQAGWTVVSIDYRLGLRDAGKNAGIKWLLHFRKALYMAVEDLFSATTWLLDHESETGIDASRVVLCGSSAGAMTCLQAVYACCNRQPVARLLPEGFSYAGVMSFAGAVFSTRGAPRFKEQPCPILLMHGTDDSLVPYRQVRFLHAGLFGSDQLAARLARAGYPYRFYRFDGYNHDVATFQWNTIPLQLEFLTHAVCGNDSSTIDRHLQVYYPAPSSVVNHP